MGGAIVGKAAPDGNVGGIVLKLIEVPNPKRHWLFCFWLYSKPKQNKNETNKLIRNLIMVFFLSKFNKLVYWLFF
jgi:hypothetical protein